VLNVEVGHGFRGSTKKTAQLKKMDEAPPTIRNRRG
jgi:hypothetical protein